MWLGSGKWELCLSLVVFFLCDSCQLSPVIVIALYLFVSLGWQRAGNTSWHAVGRQTRGHKSHCIRLPTSLLVLLSSTLFFLHCSHMSWGWPWVLFCFVLFLILFFLLFACFVFFSTFECLHFVVESRARTHNEGNIEMCAYTKTLQFFCSVPWPFIHQGLWCWSAQTQNKKSAFDFHVR